MKNQPTVEETLFVSFSSTIKQIAIHAIVIVLLAFSVQTMAQTKASSRVVYSAEKRQKKNNNMKDTVSNSTIIDIWSWHKEHAFVQGRVVNATGKIIFCAGQTSVDENGNPVNAGDMAAQVKQALDNLEAVLVKGGAKLKDVVRMTYYVKDMPAFLQANPILVKRYAAAGCNPTSTLIGVASLFHPDILFEVEATAVIE